MKLQSCIVLSHDVDFNAWSQLRRELTDVGRVAANNSSVKFYKAGHEDVKDAIKNHGLDVDWVFVFKGGEKVGDHREDHNAVDVLVKKHL